MNGHDVKCIYAREILDSRGNPTVSATVVLESGAEGTAAVPSGASVGTHEAHELRDGGARYSGKGVTAAVSSVNNRIAPALIGISAIDQSRCDSIMIALDGTRNKSNLGANAILSVSLALARAAAAHLGVPLYRYLGGINGVTLPVPMMNILNGGAHAANNIDIQEFMIMPTGLESFSEGVRACAEIYVALRNGLKARGLGTGVGDEGGFAPDLGSEREALELIVDAIGAAGYSAGEDITIALDVAASEWYSANEGAYILPKSGERLTRDALCGRIESLVRDYPIRSVEDGMAEDDIEGWRMLTERLSGRVMLVGDDLFVTNRTRLEMGVREKIANALLVKPNQIGTLSEVCEAVNFATSHGYRSIMSHRSGETEDSFIADLAVALGTPYIKSGAPARSERCAKYNRLIAIESEIFSPLYGKK